jgi:hypothetical protein
MRAKVNPFDRLCLATLAGPIGDSLYRGRFA